MKRVEFRPRDGQMRRFLGVWFVLVFALAGSPSPMQAESRQATGVKVGEVTDTSAIVWMRVTAKPVRNAEGQKFTGRPMGALPADANVDTFHGACPGAAGKVRLSYGTRADMTADSVTDWVSVKPENDYTHQFQLKDLKPGTTYYYIAETQSEQGELHTPLRGSFRTAPRGPAEVFFTLVTCQGYHDVDHADGYHIYEAMGRLKPHFFIADGDNVYYDSDAPLATSVPLARYHWHRMHSLPRHVAFHLSTSAYFLKDDHDCWMNDCWPGWTNRKMAPFTFEEGLKVFREQAPMGEKTYRTVRWGDDLQLWFVEGRDFRSPNNMPDGPAKSIWGAEQKAWLMQTLKASNAAWRILVSPTPMVGPDRDNKGDNHANKAFAHEGNEFRQWAKENLGANFFVLCGDRHWQYHSVHPETGLHEFSCGPASNEHASGTPGEDPRLHKFHRVKGGFLSVRVSREENRPTILFRHHDVHGEVVHEHRAQR
jgi:alkaline phosphatase D